MPRNRVHAVWLVLAVIACLATACNATEALDVSRPGPGGPRQPTASPIIRRRSVADLLARPPAPGQTVEVDAYFSGACGPSSSTSPAAPETPCSVDWGAVLCDKPFLPTLAVLGSDLANTLPDEAAWLVASAPAEAAAAPSLLQLPYRARFRGRLSEVATPSECLAASRTFIVEKVVRTYAQVAPAPRAAGDPATWRRYQDAQAGYSMPQPPGWRVQRVDSTTLSLRARQWPGSPITVTVRPGETHHDPYDPDSAPPLLAGQSWTEFQQNPVTGQVRLSGYRVEYSEPGGQATSVLFSAHGSTYELKARYPLGFAAPQPLLTAYSAIVAGFRFDAAPEPSPTPPVRQALGPGPFLSEEDALEAVCQILGGQLEEPMGQLISEAEARRMGGLASTFRGHLDGIWAFTVRTPLATRTQVLRLLLDAATGREICREEVDPATVPTPAAPALPTLEEIRDLAAREGRAIRWIEINLTEQSLVAWEGNIEARRMSVTTGLPGTPTVTGTFRIYWKILSITMSGPGYNLPGVPHTMFFFESYAIHGAYWRSVFGETGSHGCVNVSLPDAAWLFDWAAPKVGPGESSVNATPCNPGTLVVVHY